LNRTTLELKHHSHGLSLSRKYTLNRTTLELKHIYRQFAAIIELKL